MRSSKHNRWLPFLLTFAAIACRPGEGSHPEDMSVAGHEAAAAEAETKAVEHEAQYSPTVVLFDGPGCVEFCFRSNPTSHHQREAARLRREAARHRKASHELRVAEERACGDIPEINRDFSPFFHREEILGVTLDPDGPVVVHFAEVPKTTVDGLQRLTDCHLARNAALGHELEEMDYCPLAVRGVRAKVVESKAGFDIELHSADAETRAQVVERVETLTTPAPT